MGGGHVPPVPHPPRPSYAGPSTNLKIDEFAASCSLSATIATAVLSTVYIVMQLSVRIGVMFLSLWNFL